ncbi:MAG: YceI family protein [Rhizobacter sp.]|nr:YceI family protein [Chlorobiales bacterium]
MKKVTLFFAVLLTALLTASTIFAQTNWSLDPSHSAVRFSVQHLLVSETEGRFKKFDLTVNAPKAEDFTDAKIDLIVDVKSVDTQDAKRDEHLRTPDWFDAEKYSQITFKGKSMTKTGEKTYKLSGDLTMHGVTKPMTLDVVHNGTVKSPYGGTVAGFKLSGVLNRKDFGVGEKTPAAVVGEDIAFVCNIELNKKG